MRVAASPPRTKCKSCEHLYFELKFREEEKLLCTFQPSCNNLFAQQLSSAGNTSVRQAAA